jgi:hypothetical protein
MNYLAYTVNKTHVTIAYMQSVKFHHIEVMYKLLARNGTYHFSVDSIIFTPQKYEVYFPQFYKYCNKKQQLFSCRGRLHNCTIKIR